MTFILRSGEKGTGKLFDGIPATILTQKRPQGIVNYITTGTEQARDMPVFKTMPADEAKVITDHLLKLKKLYEYKNGPQIRQLLIEP